MLVAAVLLHHYLGHLRVLQPGPYRRHVAQLLGVEYRLHRAAVGVPADDDVLDPQRHHRIFDGGGDTTEHLAIGRYHVTHVAGNEQITRRALGDEFRYHAGVGTGNEHRFWGLLEGQLVEQLLLVGIDHLMEMHVAINDLGDGVVGALQFSVWHMLALCLRWRGAGLPAIGSALDLDQDFARVDAITLGHMHGLDGTIDGSLDLAFHLHRLTYQHGLTGLDLVALGDQHIYDVPGHAGSHMSGLAGALARLAGTADELVELGQGHFFRHAIDAQVEMPGAIALDADPGDVDAVALAMHIDHELGGHALRLGRALVAGGDRQQHLRLQGAGGTLLEELAADIREHGVGQYIFLALGQIADLTAQAIHLRLEQVRRAHVDHFLITDGADLYFGVDGARRLAVAPLQIQLHLVGNGLVTLAGQHIEYGLGADDL